MFNGLSQFLHSIAQFIFIFWRQSHSEYLLPNVNLFPLFVYFLNKGRYEGAAFQELIGGSVVFEALIDFLEAVVAASPDYHEKGYKPGETLEFPVSARKHLLNLRSLIIYILIINLLMGGMCSSKSETSMPVTTTMLYSNDPVVNNLEKTLRLSDSRFEGLKAGYSQCKRIAEHPDNSVTIDKVYLTIILQALQQRLHVIDDEVTESEKKLQNGHVQLKILKDSCSNASDFGNQVTVIRAHQLTIDEVLNRFETNISQIKYEWITYLVMQGMQEKLREKMPKQIKKVHEAQGELRYLVSNDYTAHNQELLKVLSSDEDMKDMCLLIMQKLDRQLQYLPQVDKLQDEVSKMQDKYEKESDSMTLAQMDIMIRGLKEQVQQQLIVGQGYIQSQVFMMECGGGFNIKEKVRQLEEEHEQSVKDMMRKSEESYKAFKKAVQMQQISEQDSEIVEQLKDVEKEMEEIMQTLKEIKEDQVKLENEIKEIRLNAPVVVYGETKARDIEEFNVKYQKARETQNQLIDDLYNMQRDVELKKVELSTNNIRVKLDMTSNIVDDMKDQFTEREEDFLEVYDFIYLVRQMFEQNQNIYSKMLVAQLNSLLDQIGDLEKEELKGLFDKLEMKVSEVQQFWTEREKSGEGIAKEEDAKYMMEELGELEEQFITLELKTDGFNISSKQIKDKFREVLQHSIDFVNQMVDVYIQCRRIIDKFIKHKGFEVIEGKVREYQAIKDKLNKFKQNLGKEDIIDDDFKDNAQLLASTYEMIVTKLEKQEEQLGQFKDKSAFTLEFGDSMLKLVNDQGQKWNITPTFNDFQVTDPKDQVQIRLKESTDDRQKYLNIQHLKGDKYLIGTYKTEIKMIEEVLCVKLHGGFIPMEGFIKAQYLEILQKEMSPNAEIREVIAHLRTLIIAYTL